MPIACACTPSADTPHSRRFANVEVTVLGLSALMDTVRKEDPRAGAAGT